MALALNRKTTVLITKTGVKNEIYCTVHGHSKPYRASRKLRGYDPNVFFSCLLLVGLHRLKTLAKKTGLECEE